MVQSIDAVLEQIAQQDAIAYIIAEIPTNPRVEVPDLEALKKVLSITRKTSNGEKATAPVFILDQTFCPNLHFLSDDATLSSVKAIAYASGSKFPSGGLCTALGNFDPLANEMVLTAARILSSPKKCTLGQNVWSKIKTGLIAIAPVPVLRF